MSGDRYEFGKDLVPITRKESRRLGELARKAGVESFSGKPHEIARIANYNSDFMHDDELSKELTNLLYATRCAEEQIRDMKDRGSETAKLLSGVYGFRAKDGEREKFSLGGKKTEGETPRERKVEGATEGADEGHGAERRTSGERFEGIEDGPIDLDGVDDYDDSNFYDEEPGTGEFESEGGSETEPAGGSREGSEGRYKGVRGIRPAAGRGDGGFRRGGVDGAAGTEDGGGAGEPPEPPIETGSGGASGESDGDSGRSGENTEDDGGEGEDVEKRPGRKAKEALRNKKNKGKFAKIRNRIIAVLALVAVGVGGWITTKNVNAKMSDMQKELARLKSQSIETTMPGDYDNIDGFNFEQDVPQDELVDGSDLEALFGIQPERVYRRENDPTRDNEHKQGKNRYNLATPVQGETLDERREDLVGKIEDSWDLAVIYGSAAGYGDLGQMRVSDMRAEAVRLEEAGKDSVRYDVVEVWRGILGSDKVTEFSPTDGTFYSENFTYNGSKDPNNIKRSRRSVENTVEKKGARYEGRYFDITDALSEDQQYNILYMLGLEGQVGNVEKEGARFVIRENCAQIGIYVGEKKVAEARYEEPTDEWVVTTPTPEPEVTPTPEPEVTPTPEPEVTPTPEPEVTPTPEPETTSTPEPEVTPTPEPEVTPTPEPEVTPTPEPETTPTPEPEVTPTPEPEVTPTPEPEVTPTPEPEATKDPENLQRIVEQAPTEGEVTQLGDVTERESENPRTTEAPAPQVTIAPEAEIPEGASERETRENYNVPTSTQGTSEVERTEQRQANEEAERQEQRTETESREERQERENTEADDLMRRAAEKAAERVAQAAAEAQAAAKAVNSAAQVTETTNETPAEGGEQ